MNVIVKLSKEKIAEFKNTGSFNFSLSSSIIANRGEGEEDKED